MVGLTPPCQDTNVREFGYADMETIVELVGAKLGSAATGVSAAPGSP